MDIHLGPRSVTVNCSPLAEGCVIVQPRRVFKLMGVLDDKELYVAGYGYVYVYIGSKLPKRLTLDLWAGGGKSLNGEATVW